MSNKGNKSGARRGLPTAEAESTMLQTQESLARNAIEDMRQRSVELNDDEEMKKVVKRKRNTERANVQTQLRQAAILASEARDAIGSFNHTDHLDDKLWAEDMNTRTVGMRSLSGGAISHAEIQEIENHIILDKSAAIKRNKEAISSDKTRLNTALTDMENLARDYADQQQTEENEELDPEDMN